MDLSNPIKFDIRAERGDFDCFIEAVKASENMSQTAFNPETEKSHFIIYKFLWNREKCSVVYDTAACKISLTARAQALERFKTLYLKREYYKLGGTSALAAIVDRTPAPAASKQLARADGGNRLAVANPPAAAGRGEQPGTAPLNTKGKPQSERSVQQQERTASAAERPSSQLPDKDCQPKGKQDDKRAVSPSAGKHGNADGQGGQEENRAVAMAALPVTPDKVSSAVGGRQQKTDKRSGMASAKTTGHKGVGDKTPAVKAASESGGAEAAAAPVKRKPSADAGRAKTIKKRPPADKPADQSKEARGEETTAQLEYKDGYSIKKYSLKRLEEALKAIKSMPGTSYRLDSTTSQGRADETKIYVISGAAGQKITLRYMPKKLIVQLQGKRSNLYSEVQVLISKDTDFKSAVSPHIEQTGEAVSVGNMQRRLKKILPNAFDFLDEQSKIDLAIGLIDINNSETRLSDYSSLLTPPYRGLEKFISDLQRAQGIEVKMIGQGYEKDDAGNYRLKGGYRRRIDSIVYNEVMSALYTEYFARRNFYSHSDNTDGNSPRIITDKQEVKRIFDNLIAVIDYNSKKLKEIGFSVK